MSLGQEYLVDPVIGGKPCTLDFVNQFDDPATNEHVIVRRFIGQDGKTFKREQRTPLPAKPAVPAGKPAAGPTGAIDKTPAKEPAIESPKSSGLFGKLTGRGKKK